MEKDNILTVSKKSLIISLVLVVLMAGSYLIGSYVIKKQEKELVNYQTLFDDGKDVSEKYVNLKFNSFPYLFAEKTSDGRKEKYYIVFDKDNFMFILHLNNRLYEKIEKEYDALSEEDKNKFEFEVDGTTKSIPSEMKRLAISTYNEEVKENFLTYANFEDYFGKTYLDTARTPKSEVMIIVVLVDVLLGIFTIINLGGYINQKRKLKKACDKYGEEIIRTALMAKDVDEFKNANIYLTDKYVISNVNGLEVTPYEDIYWSYKLTRKQNGITIGKTLLAFKKNKKSISIASNFDDKTLEKILEKLHDKNKNILIGYTKENQKAYKALPKIKD